MSVLPTIAPTRISNIGNTTENKTEQPCQYKDQGHVIDCKTIQREAQLWGSPVILVTAITGLILNIVVIVILIKMMKRRQTQAQIHLLALAFSDVSVCLFYPLMAVWSKTCDPCLPCGPAFVCFCMHRFLTYATSFMYIVNRFTAVYITFVRAKALTTLKNAMASLNKAPRKVLKELIIAVSIGSALLFLIGLGLMILCKFVCAIMVIYPILITMMTILASFVLIRLRYHVISSVVKDEFQRLIALVAFFYGFTLIGAVILARDKVVSAEYSWLRSFINILNSSINLFIYFIASRAFRNAFVKCFRHEGGQSVGVA